MPYVKNKKGKNVYKNPNSINPDKQKANPTARHHALTYGTDKPLPIGNFKNNKTGVETKAVFDESKKAYVNSGLPIEKKEEVKLSPQAPLSPVSSANNSIVNTKDVMPEDKKFKDGIVGNLLMGTEIKKQAEEKGTGLNAGTVPIGAVGASSLFSSKGGMIGETISKKAYYAPLENFAGAFKTTADDIAKYAKTVEGKPLPSLKSLIKNPYVKGASAVAGVDTIMSWLASDNILGGINIYTSKLPAAVTSGAISKEDALAQLDEQQVIKNQTARFIKISSIANPLMWLFGKQLMTNVNQTQRSLDLTKANINNIDMAQIEADNQYWADYRAKQTAKQKV